MRLIYLRVCELFSFCYVYFTPFILRNLFFILIFIGLYPQVFVSVKFSETFFQVVLFLFAAVFYFNHRKIVYQEN